LLKRTPGFEADSQSLKAREKDAGIL